MGIYITDDITYHLDPDTYYHAVQFYIIENKVMLLCTPIVEP